MIKIRKVIYLLIFSMVLINLMNIIEAKELIPKISITYTFRYENWNYFKFRDYQNSYVFYGLKIRPFMKIPLSNDLDLNIGLNMVKLGGLPTRAVAPSPAGTLGLGANYTLANTSLNNDTFTGIAVREFNFNYKSGNVSAKIGRFGFTDGNELEDYCSKDIEFLKNISVSGRLIGTLGFTYVERAFDGLSIDYKNSNTYLRLAYFYPTYGAFVISTANRTNKNISLSYFSYNLAPNKNTDIGIFFVNYNDHRDIIKPSNTSNVRGKTNISALGLRFIKVIPKENYSFDIVGWYNYQWGEWGKLNGIQQIKHDAYGYSIELGCKLNKAKFKPHFRVYYLCGSGDPNPVDNKHNTYSVFLVNGRKFALFPFYNHQNLKDLSFQVILSPTKKTKLRVDYSIISLNRAEDGWYLGSGVWDVSSFGIVYKPSSGFTKFANVLSVTVSYDLTPKNSITLFYSIANGKDVIKRIYENSNATYFFIELNQKF